MRSASAVSDERANRVERRKAHEVYARALPPCEIIEGDLAHTSEARVVNTPLNVKRRIAVVRGSDPATFLGLDEPYPPSSQDSDQVLVHLPGARDGAYPLTEVCLGGKWLR